MRLNRLDLTRYGRFTDARLQFPPPPVGAPDLHVIFGPNEAGKSTLFSAWLDLLYGVPARTRYDFLHPGPTLQIGAQLTHAGGALQVVRLKRNGPSLQDANGQPLPEAVLQAALAGLGRDGYAGMFSLDDDTLEQGGESILASRGDLGEMLFAASAGLAGLGPQLDVIRREIDAFHKPRARSTTLKLAKDRLADLDRQRRDLDVTASAAQKLQRDVAAADRAWAAARQIEGEADAALKAARAALAMVPQQARLARLRAELQPLADLPEATEADARALQDMDQALRELAGQIATRAASIADLTQHRDALRRDPLILPLADAITRAQGLHPLHLAALADLPRRRDRLALVMADLARTMLALGLAGAAADHVIPMPVLARLRALLVRRDVAVQALALAQDEVAKTIARLPEAEETGAAADLISLQALAHLVAQIRQADPVAATARAAQDLALREADLAEALRLLSPWQGTAEGLADLRVPAQWQVTDWEQADQATDRALRDATDDLARRRADVQAAGQTAPVMAAPSLAEAAEARRLREAAWAAHLANMTRETAASFEAALRLDDRLSQHLAQFMAEARQAADAAQTLTRLQAQLATAEAQWQAQHHQRQAFEQTLADCAASLGLPGARVADLRLWLVQRDRALALASKRDAARAAAAQAQAAQDDATADLAAALGLPVSLGHARLMAEALTRLDQAAQAQEAARHLAQVRADLTSRKTALTAAQDKLLDWRQDWQKAVQATPLTALRDDDTGLAQMLDGLDQLSRLEDERAELSDRITKMEANSHAFHDAVATVLTTLSLPDSTDWQAIPDRLAAAQQAERDQTRIAADLAREKMAQAADQARVDAQTAQRGQLAQRLHQPPDQPLADHLVACLRASRLRRDCAELAAELAPQAPADQDPDTLQAEVQRLTDRLTLARSDSEARFADLSEARRALSAVGGDDAVARIAAERANLLHDLRDQTRAHLARRFGLLAFEQGLRRYRDSHRSTMLARASDAFRSLTGGEYTALAAKSEGTTEVLVAIAAKGGAKLATDLSKGTRFQLYLALRIAGYHELAKSRPPVPFIADDIMETFDDDRSGQAFALLADMAMTGQVIYLTHHQHLCDMARRVCPSVQITDLRGL